MLLKNLNLIWYDLDELINFFILLYCMDNYKYFVKVWK